MPYFVLYRTTTNIEMTRITLDGHLFRGIDNKMHGRTGIRGHNTISFPILLGRPIIEYGGDGVILNETNMGRYRTLETKWTDGRAFVTVL